LELPDERCMGLVKDASRIRARIVYIRIHVFIEIL